MLSSRQNKVYRGFVFIGPAFLRRARYRDTTTYRLQRSKAINTPGIGHEVPLKGTAGQTLVGDPGSAPEAQERN
jgi:hypothetical protein